MSETKDFPIRKPLRLQYHDYNTPGAYFITFCTYERKCTLSRIVGAIHESPETQLTEFGRFVDACIKEIPKKFDAKIDSYVIMPNHVHLIIVLPYNPNFVEKNCDNKKSRSAISRIIGFIKMQASKEMHRKFASAILWQRGFHDHVIRGREDYEMIATYIRENPINWQFDCLYTENARRQCDISGDS